jgi:uncharacterized repeat protein (TIGR02543 family)
MDLPSACSKIKNPKTTGQMSTRFLTLFVLSLLMLWQNLALADPPANLSFISDDFCSGVLDPAWTFVDPQSDGSLQFSGASTSDAWLELSVPAGVEHQMWTGGIQAPHIIQAATDTDFELEVKFESPVKAPQYQEQGILIKQDDFNFLRFEIYSTNASTFALAAILESATNSLPLGSNIPHNQSIAALNIAPLYMRISRVGNLWTQSYSTDGINFTIVGTAFSHSLTVTGVGIYGGNATGGSSPAFTAQVDYFENVLENPITNEDNCSSSTFALTYDGNTNDGGTAPVDGSSPYQANATVTVLGPGTLSKTGFSFAGWNTQADGLGTSYAVSSTFAINANTVLYAQWTSPTQIQSDDFDRANLDLNRWTFVNPLDDGWIAMTGNNTADAYLELSVPAGPTHDPWQALNRSVRAMQPVADTDFEVEVKFDSEPDPNQAYQLQGIIVEESSNNWLRFDLNSNGSGLRIFAATTVSGSSSQEINTAVNPGEATYLKVTRLANTWTLAYSGDGATWTTAGSFTHTMAVGSIGPFVANHNQGGNNAPAFTAQVDYFFDTTNPLVPEDNGAEADTWSPFIHTIQPQAGANSLTITWYTDEPSIGAVDLGLTTAYGTTQTETVPSYFHSLTFPGMIAGNTYHYQVRSEDNLNQETTSQDYTILFDPEGPEIDVWYGDTQDFGQLGNPQEFWVNVFGNASDPDGLGSLSYTLNGGSAVSLTIGPDNRRLENAGDFNIDLNWTSLNSGANTVLITATDGLGNVSTKTVTVNYTAGNVWPLPYTADWSTLTTDGDPATPDPEIQTLSQVVDGKWSVDNGLIRTTEPGYDRLVAIGDHLSDDYEALVPITINSLKTGGFGVGLLFRWNGHTNTPVTCPQPLCGYEPLGAIGWFRNSKLEFYQGVSQSFSLSLGTTYWMRMRVENNGSNPVYSLKVWEDGQAEPTNWNLTQTEGPGTPQNGSLLLIAHEADASFGTVVITPIQGTPNSPPIANNDNASVVTGGSVNVNVLNNDSDPDGTLAPATVTVVDPPDHGTITSINLATGAITYQHDGSATTTDDFTYTVEDNDGAVSNTATVNISISSTPVLGFVSDDFCDGVLDPVWTFVDPLSDGTLQFTGANTADAWVELSVPAGAEHQLWESGIQAPHLIQAATNTDFELEVKFESPVNAPQYQEQGVLVKQDDFNFLRFEIYSTNSGTSALAAVLESSSNTFPLSSSIPINQAIEPVNTAPIYMRVQRVGSQWTQSYSTDGINFTPVGNAFTHSLTVTGVGIYGGNGIGGSSPAFTAKFDYFENVLDNPIANEDNCSSGTFTLTYDGNTNDGGTAPVDGNSPYLANATVTVLGSGTLSKTGFSFAGWNTQADGLGTSYPVSSTFAITANTTLYAQWSPVCSITALSAGTQTACDPADDTYTQEVIVAYVNEPASGTLAVNGQFFAITGSPQTVVLTGLVSDGLDVDVTAAFSDDPGCTQTEVALFTAPAACSATLNGSLTLEGRTDHSSQVTVSLYAVGQVNPVYSFTTSTDASGNFTISGVIPGAYEVAVKADYYLQSVNSVTLVAGSNTDSFGQQLAGDANDDNKVSLLDFSLLAAAYNTQTSNPQFDIRADFNGDGTVEALDFSLLASSYSQQGEEPNP